jgi:Probable molybdopterin binding domain
MTTADTPAPKEAITAALLVIGDKILSGRTKDQNIGYVAEYLTALGMHLMEVRVVGDEETAIVNAVEAQNVQIAVVTLDLEVAVVPAHTTDRRFRRFRPRAHRTQGAPAFRLSSSSSAWASAGGPGFRFTHLFSRAWRGSLWATSIWEPFVSDSWVKEWQP